MAAAFFAPLQFPNLVQAPTRVQRHGNGVRCACVYFWSLRLSTSAVPISTATPVREKRYRSCRALALAVWMQTTGAVLLATERCSPARVLTHAQDSPSAHGLL
jgi:hypothetical protein